MKLDPDLEARLIKHEIRSEARPGRWTPMGTDLSDLTFVPSAGRTQSVQLTSGCGWHGHVMNGDAT